MANTALIYMWQAKKCQARENRSDKKRKARSLTVLWNHLILLDDDRQQKGTVGTVNNMHRKRWRAGYHVMVPGTLSLWSRANGEVWWKGRGPTDKQSEGVMYIKACCVALRRWIMSQATCKLWLENNKSCWLTVVVCGEVGTPCHLGSCLNREASLA